MSLVFSFRDTDEMARYTDIMSRIIDLQMEGSSGSPGPKDGE